MNRPTSIVQWRWLVGLVLASGLALASAPARAQNRPPLIVDVEFDAAPSEDPDELSLLAGLTIGRPYRALDVRKAVRRLYQIGRFENVYVRAKRVEAGIRLRIGLPPRQVLRSFQITATEEVLDESEVLAAMGVAVDDPFDPNDLKVWRKAITEVLRREGYRDAAVGLAHRVIDEEGGIDLVLRIDEGPVTRVDRVVIRGRTRRPMWRLGEVLDIDSGDVVDLEEVDENVAALERFYRSEGYLDASIELVEVRPSPRGTTRSPRADVVLRIDAGPQVSVRYDGNRAVSTRALEEDGELLEELGTGPSALAEVRERIVSRYEQRGYWRIQVEPATRMTADGDKKEVLFSINEGPRAVVRRLTFPGNQLFDPGRLRDIVIQSVGDALGDAEGQPGADPAVVDAIVGRVSGPGTRRVPDTSAPDPAKVYIPRAYRAAQAELADLYRARGYQTVQVSEPVVVPVPGQEAVDVAIRIRPGIRWQVGAVSFSGNEQVASADLLELAGLDVTRTGGEPLAFDDVENARRTIQKYYRDLGHLYARLTEELRPLPARDAYAADELATTSTSTATDIRKFCERAESEDKPNCDILLIFNISEGPRVTTQDVLVKGVETTWESIVKNEIVMKPDEVLREKDMEQTRDNLLRLGLFDVVEVNPLEEGEVGDRKDVLVEVKERDHYWLELGVGASTEDGLRGSAAFGDGNLFGSALRLQLQARLNVWLPPLLLLYNDEIRDQIEPFYTQFGAIGRLEYEVAAGLSYPRIPGLPRGFSAGLDVIVLRDFDPAFLENTQTLTLIATYKNGNANLELPRPPSFQLRANLQRSDLECNQIFELPPDTDPSPVFLDECTAANLLGPDGPSAAFKGTNFYLSAGPRLTWDLRDASLDPKSGVYFEVEALYAVGLDADSPNYVDVNGRANMYVPLLPRLVLAISALGGTLIQVGDEDLEIPLNRRLFAGGRTTVRGYAEKTLLPQDTELDPVTGVPRATISTGGRLRVALKSELRILLFPSLALSLFYDVGDLWEDGQFSFTSETTLDDDRVVRRTLAQGAGVGLRVSTPIGPLAIDLAVPVNRRDSGTGNPQLHFAVGSF